MVIRIRLSNYQKHFSTELVPLQALNALLFPIAAPDESTAQLTQQNFVASGCISALLQGVRIANDNNSTGQSALYSDMQYPNKKLSRLLQNKEL